jgi:Glycosyl hydrolases family 35
MYVQLVTLICDMIILCALWCSNGQHQCSADSQHAQGALPIQSARSGVVLQLAPTLSRPSKCFDVHLLQGILSYAGGTGSVNLYMAHGGSNFGYWAGIDAESARLCRCVAMLKVVCMMHLQQSPCARTSRNIHYHSPRNRASHMA